MATTPRSPSARRNRHLEGAGLARQGPPHLLRDRVPVPRTASTTSQRPPTAARARTFHSRSAASLNEVMMP